MSLIDNQGTCVMRSALPVLLVVLVGCSGLTPTPSATSKIYTHAEFKKEFLGATLDEVRSKLGAPDEVNIAESSWSYRKRTKNAKTGKVDDVVTIQHIDGRVSWVPPWPED